MGFSIFGFGVLLATESFQLSFNISKCSPTYEIFILVTPNCAIIGDFIFIW